MNSACDQSQVSVHHTGGTGVKTLKHELIRLPLKPPAGFLTPPPQRAPPGPESASAQWSCSFTAITDWWTVTTAPHPAPLHHTLLPGDEAARLSMPPPSRPFKPWLPSPLSVLTIESLSPQGGVFSGMLGEGLQR